MKKVLFASVAAIAFGAAAQAAEPVKLSIGGFAFEQAGYVSNSQSADYGNGGGAGSAQNRLSSVDVQDDVRIKFTGATKLDNGIGVSVEVDTMGTQGMNSHTYGASNKNVAKSFVAVSTVAGTVEAGEQDNVGALIHNSAPDVAQGFGGNDGYWTNWAVAPTNFAESWGRTYAGDDRSANKIIYVSPTFYGLAAGFSYTPSIQKNSSGFVTAGGHTTVPSSADYNGGLNGDLYVYGLAYNNTCGDVTIKADAGSGNANVAGLHVYQGGLNVGYKGFTVGGSYLKRDIDGSTSGNVSTGTAGLTGAQVAAAAKVGNLWDAGISYVTGPYGVSFNYFHGTAANTNGSTKGYTDDRDHIYTLSGSYEMGPGVTLSESLFSFGYNSGVGGSTGTANSNTGWGAVTGLNVAF